MQNIDYDAFLYCTEWNRIEVTPDNTNYYAEDGILYSVDKETLVRVPLGLKGQFIVKEHTKKIGSVAFSYCSNLTDIIISGNIEKIETSAFHSCYGLINITIGKNVKTIESNAFIWCSSLKKVVFENGSSIAGCNLSAFHGCSSWTEVEIKDENSSYTVENNVIYSHDKKDIIRVPTGINGEFTINNNVETISKGCFMYCENLTTLNISDSVKQILPNAFHTCTKLENINIGSNLNTINNKAFWLCSNIKNITIDSPFIVSALTSEEACGNIIKYAETIYINNNIENIGTYIIDNFYITTTDKEGYNKYILYN